MNIINSWRFQRTAQALSGEPKFDLVSQPPYVGVAENVMSYKFTPKVFPIAGNLAYMQIAIVGHALNGSIFTLTNSNGDSITLVASTTPSAGQFLTFTSGTSLSTQFRIGQSIMYELMDTVFGQFYDIWVQSNILHIRALNYGSQFTLGFSGIPGALVITSNVAGSSLYQIDNYIDYSLYAEVFVTNASQALSGTTTNVVGGNVDRFASIEVGQISLPYYGADWLFNVDGYLKDYVGIVVPSKNPNFNVEFEELDKGQEFPIMRGYFMTTGDSFRYVSGGEKKRMINACTDVQYVQNGALDLMYGYNLGDYMLSPSSPLTLKFLNSWSSKDTRLDANEYLQFIESKSGAVTSCPFGVEVTFRFIDGSSVTRDYGLGNFNATFGGNISVDVSPRKVRVDQEEASFGVWVDYYEVKLYWQVPTFPRYYSEAKRYRYKRECGEGVKSIIWFNELGAWDSITVKDYENHSINRELSMIERVTPLEPSPEKDIMRVYKNNYNKVYDAITFELGDNDYKLVEGMLKSTAVYLYDPVVNQYVPIVINDSSFNKEANQDVKNVIFQYVFTYPTNTITR